MPDSVQYLVTCLGVDEEHAKMLAARARNIGHLEHAAMLQRASDELRHVRTDLVRGFSVPRTEVVDTVYGEVIVGGEG